MSTTGRVRLLFIAPTRQFLTKEAMMSTRKFSRLLLAPMLVVASMASAPGASAAPPQQARGTFGAR